MYYYYFYVTIIIAHIDKEINWKPNHFQPPLKAA